jgi:hypothetical protein
VSLPASRALDCPPPPFGQLQEPIFLAAHTPSHCVSIPKATPISLLLPWIGITGMPSLNTVHIECQQYQAPSKLPLIKLSAIALLYYSSLLLLLPPIPTHPTIVYIESHLHVRRTPSLLELFIIFLFCQWPQTTQPRSVGKMAYLWYYSGWYC